MNDKAEARVSRRKLIGGALAGAVAAPHVANAQAAQTTVLKVQTSWPAGVGLDTFKTWCTTIKEKTGGELEFKGFAAKELVGDFELLDGVRNGVVEAMNSFTLYWAGKVPATAFLSSYVLGLRFPHEWDMFFYSMDGLKTTREIFAKLGVLFDKDGPLPLSACITSTVSITAPISSTRRSRSARSTISRT
ncbi:MAG TPA: hypothetical protein PLE50_01375 [Rhabdaerophilum sp.]|nr:hypothetical protein [Rhabdaerophilum sp.]